jgi:acetylornithine/N-succinyldiaminopimelate aminotransferase
LAEPAGWGLDRLQVMVSTPPPALSSSLHERFLRHVGQTSPFPNSLQPAWASGCVIVDRTGREYLDFISGIAVCNVGHSHPDVLAAVARQMGRYAHTMVYGEHVQQVQVELAEALARVAPPGLDCAYFMTTGAEANDAALKMAAKLTGRRHFRAFRGAYHGDTMGALSCFGDEGFRLPHRPILHVGVEFLRFNVAEDLEHITPEVAGVLVEPVQGEAGIRVPDCEWLPALRARCTEVGAMLIFDEVQTGLGRIGDWFAARWFGVVPDAITLAKGLGAGLPLAALLAARDQIFAFAADPPFSHITTFGGHPVCCAAALAGMEVLEREGLLERSRLRGEQLRQGLEVLAHGSGGMVSGVRGVGLMVGFDLPDAATARRIVEAAKARGLIVETNLLSERTIRLSPPLIVTEAQCQHALTTLSECLREG